MPDAALFDAGLRAIVPGKRGRGATALREHTVRLAGPSIAGRYELTFRYRRLKTWDPALLERVERTLCYYFQHVGGFRIADDAVVRHWVQLCADYDADELRWAIDAKAASLKGDTREESREKRSAFTPRADNFQPGLWLERHPDYQRRQAALAKRAASDRLDAVGPVSNRSSAGGPASGRSSSVGPVSNRPSEPTAPAIATPSETAAAARSVLQRLTPAAAPCPPERSIAALARAGGPASGRSLSEPTAPAVDPTLPPFVNEALREQRRVDVFLGQLKESFRREAGARLRRDRPDYKIWYDALGDAEERDEYQRKCVYQYLLAQEILRAHPGLRRSYAEAI